MKVANSKDVHGKVGTRLHRLKEPSGASLLLWQALFAGALLLAWHLMTFTGVLDPFFFSTPSRVAQYLATYLASAQFIADLTFTLRAAITGYILGGLGGVTIGFLLAYSTLASRILNPFILALYGVPRIALAPLFIVWFGIGITSKVALAAMVSFFLAFFPTFTGVRQVNRSYVNVALVAGANRRNVLRKVVLPASSPWIISGLRIAIPYAIVAAIVGEFIASTHGLGFRIVLNAQTFNMTGTLGGVVVVMLLVLLANLFLDRVEGYVLRWQPRGNRGMSQGL